MKRDLSQSSPDTAADLFSRRRAAAEVDSSRPAPEMPHRPVRRRSHRLAWSLGTVAAVLAAVFGLIHGGFVDLDVVRATVLSHVPGVCGDQGEAYTFLGKHYSAAGRTNDAINACERLVQVEPESPQAHVLLGDAYQGDNRSEEALVCYSDAIGLDPNCYEAYSGMAAAYTRLGRHDEAIDSYKQAIHIKPRSASAYVSMGLVFSKVGRYDEAMEAFKQAKELDPTMSEVQMLSGKAYLEVGMDDKAVECFKGIIQADEGHARARYNLGRAYLRAGDRALALREQQRLQQLDAKLADQLLDLIENGDS